MKYIKLFMLMAVAPFFAACSDDDDYNSNNATTVEFESAQISFNENEGIVNVPVKVSGARNGKIRLTVSTAETGEAPAKADENYLLTSNTIYLDADTMTSNTMNVELKIVNDRKINEDRTFNITIDQADGAKIGTNKTTTVTIVNDDKTFYDIFAGEWVLTYTAAQRDDKGAVKTDENGEPLYQTLTANVTLSAISDPSSDGYQNTLLAYSPSFTIPALGGGIPATWAFSYKYNESTKKGTLGFECTSDYTLYRIPQYGYEFQWRTDGASGPEEDEIKGSWTPTDDNDVPSEITFNTTSSLYFYEVNTVGEVDQYFDLKLTKKN